MVSDLKSSIIWKNTNKATSVVLFLFLLAIGWFSVALAGNLNTNYESYLIEIPIRAYSLADYSVDETGFKIPAIEIDIIEELTSPEIMAKVENELAQPVPLEQIDTGNPPTVRLSLAAYPAQLPEPGGLINFHLLLSNLSSTPITITELTDTRMGNLGDLGCVLNLSIDPYGLYTCDYQGQIEGNAGDTFSHELIAIGGDTRGNLYEKHTQKSVQIMDVLPNFMIEALPKTATVTEPGGMAEIKIAITNTSLEPLEVIGLYGGNGEPLSGQGDCNSPENPYPSVLDLGQIYACQFLFEVDGNAGDVVPFTPSAIISDDEGNQVNTSSTASILIADAPPSLSLTRSVSPAVIAEPGGSVAYSITISNTSLEPLVLIGLLDDVFGNLSGNGTCLNGTSIAPGESYSCSFNEEIQGDAGDILSSKVTAWLGDDEGNTASAEVTSKVRIDDLAPVVVINNTPSLTTLAEPGGTLTHAVNVQNLSTEEIGVTGLHDSHLGSLNATGTCGTAANPFPSSLAEGDSYTCQFDVVVSADQGDEYSNVITVSVDDNEGNSVSASAAASVSITDVLPTLTLDIQADPAAVPEPGGDVLYSLQIQNTSPEALDLASLTDSQFGDLTSRGCSLGSIVSGGLYTCSFTAPAVGDAGEGFHNSSLAVAWDNDGNSVSASAAASVSITDVLPTLTLDIQADPAAVPEPGGDVLYSLQIQNTSPEALDLASLTDSQFGDLTSSGCSLGSIVSGGLYTCTFTAPAVGDAGEHFFNSSLAVAWDNDGNSVSASAAASVSITDVLPTLTLDIQADPAAVPEPGGDVLYSLQIQNTSPEATQILSLVSDRSGNLDGLGNCSTGDSLLSGALYTCSFPWTATENSAGAYLNTISAAISDNEGNQSTASSTAGLEILDTAPSFALMITPDRSVIMEPGGTVVYSTVVENTAQETITLISLTDDKFGDINGLGSCSLPQAISPGGVYVCSYPGLVIGSEGDIFTNLATGVVQDDELNQISGTSLASVFLTEEELPTIDLIVTPSDPTIPEPGGLITYTITIHNTFDEELLLSNLMDNQMIDLNGAGTCTTPQNIPEGEYYECAFPDNIEGNAGSLVSTIISAVVWDDGTSVTQSEQTAITITDATPTVEVSLGANTDAITAPGEDVEFSLVIENTSGEDIVLTNLINDHFGNLNGQGTCSNNRIIEPSAAYTCTFTGSVVGNPGDTWNTLVMVNAADDEANSVSASDTLSIAITAPIPVDVSGQVRLDTDIDGDLTDPDVGLAGVMIELYDGSCVIGHTCRITVTDSSGIFLFSDVPPGIYTILEADPQGYGSTADTQGTNDNQILVTVESGIDCLGNVFLDTNQTASIRGQVRDDRDGDGDLGDNDPGIYGVTIELPDGICTPGLDCRSTVTDQDGFYYFEDMLAGEYLIVARDLPDYFSTADADFPNDNQIRITLMMGVDATGNDFLDSAEPSFCTDPDPLTGYVSSTMPNDGQLVPLTTNTIEIGFNQAMATSGADNVLKLDSYDKKVKNLTFGGDIDILSVTYHALTRTATLLLDTADPNWVPGSQFQWMVKGGLKNACGTHQGLDLVFTFNTMSGIAGQVRYDEDSDGDLGDNDPGIPGSTIELVSADCVPGSCPISICDAQGYFQFSDLEAGEYTLFQHDLPGFTSTADADGEDPGQIEIFLGSPEFHIGRDFLDIGICSPPDPMSGFVTSTLPAEGQQVSIFTDTLMVTFNQAMAASGGGDVLDRGNYDNKIANITYGGDIDILSVTYHSLTRTATLLIDTADPDWLPGSTYHWMVKSNLENTCGVQQDIDLVFTFNTMSGIAGQVRYDSDADGDLSDNDSGISGINLELISASCAPGTCPTSTSNGEGYFLFPDLAAGNYTLVQNDFPGFTSTADVDGGSPSQIEISLGTDAYLPGQNFLDTSNCFPPDPLQGYVTSTNPADGSILVPMILDTMIIQFNQPMSTDGADSVLDKGNYENKLNNLSAGGDVPIIGVDYQADTYQVTLSFDTSDPDWQPGSDYSLTIDRSIKNACKVDQGIDVLIGFQTTSAISGQVREDFDGDGNLSDPDPGIPSVIIELLDGICSQGVDCRTATTNTGGYYIFPDVSPGIYTLVEANLPGYTSTADADNGSPDSISIHVGAGPPSAMNDFLDTNLPLAAVIVDAETSSLPGGSHEITFSMTVSNISAETATLVSLSENTIGNLNGQGTCSTGQTLSAGSSYTCTYAKTVSGAAGEEVTISVFGTLQDAVGNLSADSGSTIIQFIDI